MSLAGLKQRPAYFLYQWMWTALDWVFPPRCADCGVLGERWCGDCQNTLTPIQPPLCSNCGVPISSLSSSQVCQECAQTPPAYRALRSCCAYQGTARKVIHRLKYGQDIGLGEIMARPMLELLNTLSWPVDLVTCVPLSKGRMRQRGYNQAAMLARPIALGLKTTFQPLLLRKTREAPSQVGLSAHDRRRNVEDAFETGGVVPKSKRILIIDDVTTTGSTMNACARALIDAGAQEVVGLTFARAGLHDHNHPT